MGDARRDQPGKRKRLASARLRVADPQLDGPKRVVGPHAPPQLRRLDNRVRSHQEIDEICIGRPVAERLVDTAARKRAGEDLGPHRVEPSLLPIEERRVRGQREQLGQDAPQVIANRDRAIRVAHTDVDVEAPRVVALGDPAELLAQALVVRRVNDLLVQVAGPGVGAGGRELDAELVRGREEARPVLPLTLHRFCERLRLARANLDFRGDELARNRVSEHLVRLARGVELLEAVHQIERLGVDQGELLLKADREIDGGSEELAGLVEIQVRIVLGRGHALYVR